MEPLFLAAIFGCNAGLLRDALHEVYIPRIQRGNQSFAANILGARGALLSVLAHFLRTRTLRFTVGDGRSRNRASAAEDQLFILMQAGLYLIRHPRDVITVEAQICCAHAESVVSFA